SGIPVVVIEMNPQSVKEMKQQDLPVIYGDAGQTHILNSAVIKKAKLLVIATNDPASSPLILKRARQINPTLQIILRARYLNQVERLEQQGADIVVPEELETTVRLFRHVLGAYLIPEQEIERQVNNLRADDYQIMRGSVQEAHLMVLKGLDDEGRSEEHTSELQSRFDLVCRLLLEKKKRPRERCGRVEKENKGREERQQ